MSPVVAVVAPGAMGSAVGGRLVEHGLAVLTSLEGRSAGSRERAASCGLTAASDEAIASRADLFLSIVPPGEAAGLAERFAAAFRRVGRAPVYVDCNAVDVRTVERIEGIAREGGGAFVDGGIIGSPPRSGEAGPTLYLSGEAAAPAAVLDEFGLKVRVIDGPVGAASALKMAYAGITKGLTAVAATIVLAATRAGAAEALRDELAASQPQLLARFGRGLPDMLPKAYRWVAEMREIAAFIGDDRPESAIYEGAARLYDRLAQDREGEGEEAAILEAFARAATEASSR